jgi:protocatechuate 3,4-dioxygenase alpha subunit
MLEIWQADGQGRFADRQDTRATSNTSFVGFGRCSTNADGGYSFHTTKPGAVIGPANKPQAPHVLLAIYARGMTRQMVTRIYFEDEAANAADPIPALIPADRRPTLIAKREQSAGDAVFRFDVHLQGNRETVFFDV